MCFLSAFELGRRKEQQHSQVTCSNFNIVRSDEFPHGSTSDMYVSYQQNLFSARLYFCGHLPFTCAEIFPQWKLFCAKTYSYIGCAFLHQTIRFTVSHPMYLVDRKRMQWLRCVCNLFKIWRIFFLSRWSRVSRTTYNISSVWLTYNSSFANRPKCPPSNCADFRFCGKLLTKLFIPAFEICVNTWRTCWHSKSEIANVSESMWFAI